MPRQSQLSTSRFVFAGGGVKHLRLPDGASVEVRQLERKDRRGLAAAAERLSSETMYLRFASPKTRMTERELDLLTDIDHHSREALIAVDPGTRRGVAVARYMQLAHEPGVADVAVTVDDAWQERGLGGALLALLIQRAAAEGLLSLRGTALAENARSVAMLRRAGFRPRSSTGSLKEFELPLSQTYPVPSEALARGERADA
jgi:RimJ/RimL family protein N-acetyltransferase